MDISEIRVKLIPNPSDRLKAFCSVTLDGDFVIRDIKIIDGTSGTFVAMPSRKLADRCPNCGGKNHLRARFCNDCGAELDRDRAVRDELGRTKLHADIAHPINTECRQTMQEKIVAAFKEELERSDEPGYEPVDLDEEGDDAFDGEDFADEAFDEQEQDHPDQSTEAAFDDDDEDSVDEAITEVDYGTDDYNELIEDLKRSSGERRQKSRSGGSGGRSRDRGDGNRSRGRGGGRQEDRKGGRERSSDRRDKRGGRKEGGRSGDGRPQKHRDVAKPVVREQAPPSRPPVAPPPPPPVDDDNDDFGAGIL